jgi:hypothetical protein
MKVSDIENISVTDESLDVLFTRLIADQDNVNQNNVTPEYIRKQREEKIYPNQTFDLGSDYGGYDGFGLTFLSRNEIKKIFRETD